MTPSSPSVHPPPKPLVRPSHTPFACVFVEIGSFSGPKHRLRAFYTLPAPSTWRTGGTRRTAMAAGVEGTSGPGVGDAAGHGRLDPDEPGQTGGARAATCGRRRHRAH